MLTFRLAVVHSLPSAILLDEAIAPDTFWSFGERCLELAPPTNPNAILSATTTALIRLVVMLSSRSQGVSLGVFSCPSRRAGTFWILRDAARLTLCCERRRIGRDMPVGLPVVTLHVRQYGHQP